MSNRFVRTTGIALCVLVLCAGAILAVGKAGRTGRVSTGVAAPTLAYPDVDRDDLMGKTAAAGRSGTLGLAQGGGTVANAKMMGQLTAKKQAAAAQRPANAFRTRNAGDDACEFATAIAVPPDFATAGGFHAMGVGDQDFYSITLTEPHVLAIETLPGPGDIGFPPYFGSDTDLYLYGGCTPLTPANPGFPDNVFGAPIAQNGDRNIATDWTSFIQTPCLAAGTYYVEIDTWFGFGAVVDFAVSDLGTCVVPAPDAYEYDDEMFAGTKLKLRKDATKSNASSDASAIQSRTIFPAGDIDFMYFDLSKPKYAKVIATDNVAGAPGDIAMYMGYRNNGLVTHFTLDFINNGAEFEASIGSCLDRGEWYVAVIGWLASYEGFYELSAFGDHKCKWESEPNGLPGLADEFKIKNGYGVYYGVNYSVPFFDDDWWYFDLDEDRRVVLQTLGYDDAAFQGGFDVDTHLFLFDEFGGYIADNDDNIQYLAGLNVVLTAGRYYAVVIPSAFETTTDTWVYGLEITTSDPPAPPITETESNDTCATANALALGLNVDGAINPGADRDYYSFSVPATGSGGMNIRITTTGVAFGDEVISLWDSTGATLVGCEDYFLHDTFACCVPSGVDYCAAIADFLEDSVIPFYNAEFFGDVSDDDCFVTGPCDFSPGSGCDAPYYP